MAKKPGLNKAYTSEELEHKRILAERYDLPIVEEEVDVEAERKAYEAAEKKRLAKYAADVANGRLERIEDAVRVGANPERVAATIAAQTRKPAPMTPEEQERVRQAEIIQARAVRYGEVVYMGSDGPNATPEQIAKRDGAWKER